MRRSGSREENKRILMDLEVRECLIALLSGIHIPYILQGNGIVQQSTEHECVCNV